MIHKPFPRNTASTSSTNFILAKFTQNVQDLAQHAYTRRLFASKFEMLSEGGSRTPHMGGGGEGEVIHITQTPR